MLPQAPSKHLNDLSSTTCMVCTLSKQGFLKKLSPAWSTQTGFSETELAEFNFMNFLDSRSQPTFEQYFEQLQQGKSVLNVPLMLKRKDGCSFEVLMHAAAQSLQPEDAGYNVEFRTLSFYMNSIKETEELLVKERFLTTSNQLRAEITQISLQALDTKKFLSQVEALLNQRPEFELLHSTTINKNDFLRDLNSKHGNDEQPHSPVWIQILDSQTLSSQTDSIVSTCLTLYQSPGIAIIECPTNPELMYKFEFTLHCFDVLQTHWVEALEDIFNHILNSLIRIHDEYLLQKTQKQLSTLVENVEAVGFEFDLNQQLFCYVSPKIKDLLGYQAHEWHSFSQWLALIHNEDRSKVKAVFHNAQTNVNQKLAFQIRTKSGEFVWVLIHTTLELENKTAPKLLGVLIDISDQKKIELDLEKAIKQSQELTQEQQTLLSLFDMGDIVLFKWRNNENWNVDYVSMSIEQLLGYAPEEFTKNGKLYGNCIHPHDLQRVLTEVQNAIATNQTFFKHLPYRVVDKDNQVKWVSDITYILRDSSHQITNFIGYVYDVTIERDAHNQLQSILDLQDDIIIVTDGIRIQFANKSFFNFFKIQDNQQFQLKQPNMSRFFKKENGHYFADAHENWLRNIQKLPDSKRLVALEDHDGNRFSFIVKTSRFSETSYVVSFSNITETLKERDYFHYLSQHDQLTTCLNREYLYNQFEKLYAATKRNNQRLALILIDIDYFKKINDVFGHNIGDMVLKEVSSLIKTTIRIHDKLIRWGGEEFVLIAEVDSLESAQSLAEHLRHSIEQKRFPSNISTTASFGVTLVQENEPLKEVVSRADEALYLSKKTGRNKVSVYKA